MTPRCHAYYLTADQKNAVFTFEVYLRTVFVALFATGFCSCVTGRTDCDNDGRTTVAVTGICPLGLITEAGGLVEV